MIEALGFSQSLNGFLSYSSRGMLKMLAQVIINGLLQGGFYACIGVSFSIVFGIMKLSIWLKGLKSSSEHM